MIWVSAFLFCLTMAIAQAWLMRLTPFYRWLWIGFNLIGLALALFVALKTLYFLPVLFPRLDVLQNSQHAAMALWITAIAFGTTWSLSQWLVLRGQVHAPMLRSVTNVLLGTVSWTLMVAQLAFFLETSSGIPWMPLLLVGMAGLVVGAVANWLITVLSGSRV
ncbi:MAG TPA: hypothetical protein V6C57_11305 [Coleofasciculaceae cyanobacterium]